MRRFFNYLTILMITVLFVFSCNIDVGNEINELDDSYSAEISQSRAGIRARKSKIKTIKKIIKDIEKEKSPRIISRLTKNIEWTVTGIEGVTPLAGLYRGRSEVRDYLAGFYSAIDISDITIQKIEENAGIVKSFIRLKGVVISSDRTIDLEYVITWNFHARCKIDKVLVEYNVHSWELAFTSGKTGHIISDFTVSEGARGLHTYFMVTRDGVCDLSLEALRGFYNIQDPFIPEDGVVEQSTINGRETEKVYPNGAVTDKLIVYIHGGAFNSGTLVFYRPLTYLISESSNVPVLAVDYRLAPENPYPAGLDDNIAVYLALLNDYDSENILLMGDSAGGNYIFSLMLYLKQNNLPLPGGAVGLSPWLDLTDSVGSMVFNQDLDAMLTVCQLNRSAAWYLGSTPIDHPLVSPINAIIDKFPPVYLAVSSSEILMSDSTRLFNKLSGAGSEVTIELVNGMIHVWPYFGLIESGRTIERIGNFIKSALDLY